MSRLRRALADALRGRVASDPGLLRLRLALRATVAVALSSAVLHVVGPAVGLPGIVAMLLGGMIGMNGAFATSSRTPADAARTLCAFPLAGVAGAAPAAVATGHSTLQLAGFVVVMVVAVYVRRLGPRWFNYGMIAWFAYFFTTFVGISVRRLPALLVVFVVATLCVALAATLLVPDRPQATRTAAARSFQARIAGLAAAARDVVTGATSSEQAEGRLHAASFRLVEVALILDGYLADTDGQEAAAVRRRLLESELAAEELGRAAAQLGPDRLGRDLREPLTQALQGLVDGDLEAARAALQRVRAAVRDGAADGVSGPVRDAASAIERLARVQQRAGSPDRLVPGEYQPAVDLYLGNLPGTAGSVADIVSRSRLHWTLNTRLCVQTAIASSIALLLGRELSEQRYYWAVLACFLVLTGTFTTGEATAKGVNRVLGTVGGLVAATVAVHVTGSNDAAVVGVMLVSVFLGLYFFRVSYALMTFAVTTVMGELYSVLHEFSDQLLLLRLEETVLGAGVATVVVLLVLPVRTADARASVREAFLRELAALLDDLDERLRCPGKRSNLLYDARRLDAKLHQVAQVTRPGAGATLAGLSRRSAVQAVGAYTETAYRARALAAAVTAVEPGTRPDVAARCADLARRCDGKEPEPGPTAPAGQDELHELVDQLQTAAEALGVPATADASRAEAAAR